MPGEKLCKVLLLYRKRSPGKRLFAPRPFLLSYTIPPLRHFLRVRRPSAKKSLAIRRKDLYNKCVKHVD